MNRRGFPPDDPLYVAATGVQRGARAQRGTALPSATAGGGEAAWYLSPRSEEGLELGAAAECGGEGDLAGDQIALVGAGERRLPHLQRPGEQGDGGAFVRPRVRGVRGGELGVNACHVVKHEVVAPAVKQRQRRPRLGRRRSAEAGVNIRQAGQRFGGSGEDR